jgi:hypothetical protein
MNDLWGPGEDELLDDYLRSTGADPGDESYEDEFDADLAEIEEEEEDW